jgi:hypothetical protein
MQTGQLGGQSHEPLASGGATATLTLFGLAYFSILATTAATVPIDTIV